MSRPDFVVCTRPAPAVRHAQSAEDNRECNKAIFSAIRRELARSEGSTVFQDRIWDMLDHLSWQADSGEVSLVTTTRRGIGIEVEFWSERDGKVTGKLDLACRVWKMFGADGERV